MTRINDIRYTISLLAICFALSSCAWTDGDKTQGAGTKIDGINVSQEMEDYISQFVSLYTSDAMDSGEDAEEASPALIIEESDYPADSDNGALLVKYSDREGKLLRYQLCLYGETGNTIVDYYFCEHFVWIHKQDNHYSSAVLKAGYYDILYSEDEDYILMGEDIYVLHDDKTVEKLEETGKTDKTDRTDAIEETAVCWQNQEPMISMEKKSISMTNLVMLRR